METAEAIQKKIDECQERMNKALQAIRTETQLKCNKLYEERQQVLSKAPKNFWAMVFRSHRELTSELFGSYDDRILDHLEKFNVTYLPDGGEHVEMAFSPNEFFSDKSLWLESNTDNDDLKFSGVHWKPGHGPITEEDDDAADNNKKVGEKRPRPETDTRGETFFSVFEDMGPHPEFSDGDDEDKNAIENAADGWDDDMESRREVLNALVNEAWADPVSVIMGEVGGSDDEGDDEEGNESVSDSGAS